MENLTPLENSKGSTLVMSGACGSAVVNTQAFLCLRGLVRNL
jgi:hypothetical protein